MKTILVGNGPSILETEMGNVIDSFDVVVRFNTFYIDGFEKHTGTKTDIWAVNFGYIAYPSTNDINWTMKCPIPKTIVFGKWTTLELYPNYEKLKSMNFPSNTSLCSEKTAKAADKFFTGKTWASTGLMAIMEFSPCSIIGFDCFSSNKHHYVDDGAKNTFHSPEDEREFIREMEMNGLVSRL